MKLAVCFFGHLRTFKRCAPYLKLNFLKHYDCDLFIHTWSDYNHQTKTWHENKEIKGCVSQEEIIETYGEFKDICIEKQIIQNLGDITVATDKTMISLFGIQSMYHSMKKSYNLCEKYSIQHGINYDYVIMIRPDIALTDRFIIEQYVSVLNEDEKAKAFFTISNDISPVTSGFKFLRATDLLFFARSQALSKILNHTQTIVDFLANNRIINIPPEIKFIDLVQELGFAPYVIKYSGWEIIRKIERKRLIKEFIRIRVGRKGIKIHLLKYILIHIFSIRINLFNFEINCCIGKSYPD